MIVLVNANFKNGTINILGPQRNVSSNKKT